MSAVKSPRAVDDVIEQPCLPGVVGGNGREPTLRQEILGDQANNLGMTVQADWFIRALNRNPEFAYFYMTEDVGDGRDEDD